MFRFDPFRRQFQQMPRIKEATKEHRFLDHSLKMF